MQRQLDKDDYEQAAGRAKPVELNILGKEKE
jgi:hypothetical protein